MSHTRLDQLSDGIFAIVMTLLVIDIRIPEVIGNASNQVLWDALVDATPLFLSYFLSFSLLFTYWRAHHFFITIYAKNVDMKLGNINALFFLLISLIPFSAHFLGQYSQNELAVVIFGSHIILIGLTLYLMRRYVLYSDHIRNPDIPKREISGSTIRTLVPVFFAALAILISFFNITVSLTIFTLVIIFNLSSTSAKMFTKLFKLS